ncbi:MAG: hypothetical protein LBD23_11635 [Oscillospiraceae bacterium]|jgi:uridine kinase|nr:hypothetical protein [Oscillospiraceae bacterium]
MVVQQLINKINELSTIKENVIVAVEGMAAAGKSSLASLLKERYSCNIFSMDDFFLRPEQRTPERLAEPGGNIDYERFTEEIITPLVKPFIAPLDTSSQTKKTFTYRPYDCKIQELTASVTVNVNSLSIIEGVYCMHPKILDLSIEKCIYDISVFMKIDEYTQRQRLQERSPHLYERFINEWIPMENMYFKHFQIPEKCDILIES